MSQIQSNKYYNQAYPATDIITNFETDFMNDLMPDFGTELVKTNGQIC